MLAAAAVMMLAACNGPKETHLSAQFGDNTPEHVKVIVGDKFDSMIKVKDGKLDVDVPVDVTRLSRIRTGASVYSFISDGSKITVNPDDGKAYSNKKNGVHSRYVEYTQWREDFLAEYYKKQDEIGNDKEAADTYFNEMQAQYYDHLKATVKANKSNILSMIALSQMEGEDAKVRLSLINSLSSKMKAHPDVVKMKKACEDALK